MMPKQAILSSPGRVGAKFVITFLCDMESYFINRTCLFCHNVLWRDVNITTCRTVYQESEAAEISWGDVSK